MGKVILVASGKGGCGKTTIAVNLGYTLAEQGKKTVLLDMNIGLRNLDIYMGLQDSVLFDFGDYLSGTCKLDKALIRDYRSENIALLSCPQLRGIKGLTPMHIKVLVSQLKERFDYVIIDCPTVMGEQFSSIAAAADSAIVVITPDYVSLRNCEAIDRKLQSMDIYDKYYVINMLEQSLMQSSELPDLMTICQTMKASPACLISFDLGIHLANNSGEPIALQEDSHTAQAFRQLAARIL